MPSHVARDPQSDRLRAMAARYYVDHTILAREKEQLFFRTWQYACHVDELDSPGAFVTTEVLGQNVFVVRSEGGEIRAFYNVCPHRGHKLVDGKGNKSTIVCPYHQWSFALDGSVRGTRTTSTSHAPEKARIHLSAVRVDRLLDFVFVNLDPQAEPIADFWPGLEEHITLSTCRRTGRCMSTTFLNATTAASAIGRFVTCWT